MWQHVRLFVLSEELQGALALDFYDLFLAPETTRYNFEKKNRLSSLMRSEKKEQAWFKEMEEKLRGQVSLDFLKKEFKVIAFIALAHFCDYCKLIE